MMEGSNERYTGSGLKKRFKVRQTIQKMIDLMPVHCTCICDKNYKGKGELVKSLVANSLNEEIKPMTEL